MVKSVVSSLNMPTLEFLKLGDFKLAAYSHQESIQVTEAFLLQKRVSVRSFLLDTVLLITVLMSNLCVVECEMTLEDDFEGPKL